MNIWWKAGNSFSFLPFTPLLPSSSLTIIRCNQKNVLEKKFFLIVRGGDQLASWSLRPFVGDNPGGFSTRIERSWLQCPNCTAWKYFLIAGKTTFFKALYRHVAVNHLQNKRYILKERIRNTAAKLNGMSSIVCFCFSLSYNLQKS